MTGAEDLTHRAALVDAAAATVRASQRAVADLGDLRWRSPAALAYRAAVDDAVADLARSGGWLEDLAGDLRRLAKAVGGGGRG